MFKFAFALVVGISIGYFYGFDDAKKHTENVVTQGPVWRLAGRSV